MQYDRSKDNNITVQNELVSLEDSPSTDSIISKVDGQSKMIPSNKI